MARVVELLGGRYEVEELIGSGGMGDVFRARDVRLERTVAVKRPSASFTGSSRERFRREAQSAARLNHPHVVTVYDWGDDDAEAYLVMEHVEGRSLRALLHDHGPLAPAEVARVGAQIADALAHAHAKGVIHRDVKPSNVLLTTVGTVKVTDFGIAQATGEAITDPGVVIGTAGYLAPEVVAGQRADARSDVYSLGVLLTELLTGSREPDDADDGTVDEPGSLAELRRVIRRARAVDRTDRYARATEMREALRTCARDTDGIPAFDPALASSAPRTGAVVDVPTGTVAALTGTVADPTKVNASPPRPTTTPAAAPPVAPAVPATIAAPTPPPGTAAKDATALSRRARRKAVKRDRAAAAAAVAVAPVPPAVQPAPAVAAAPAPAQALPAKPGEAPSTRRWRFPQVAWLVAAPVTLALAAAGVLAYRVLTTPPETTVPAVLGTDVFSGAGAIEKAGLEYRLVEVQNPSPGGTVLELHPRAGRTLHEGDTVALHYSSSHAYVPDVIGKGEDDAGAALRDLGLTNITPVDDYTDAVAPGTVTGTEPRAYLAAVKADPVTVKIARDPSVSVPRGLVNQDEASARFKLGLAGLVVTTQTENSRTVAAGRVIGVKPGEGSSARRGDTVVLRVSSGPRPVTVRPVVTWDADDAYDELSDDGFVVNVAYASSAKKDAGTVVAQSPSGGQAPEGSTVTITVGRG